MQTAHAGVQTDGELLLLSGWGRATVSASRVVRPSSYEQLEAAIEGAPERGVIARGLGRSYGDVAQNAGGLVVDTTAMDRVLGFDPESGIATVEAGCSLEQLIRAFLPLGWFPIVTPGTRWVTVGGAIACDVHGKNHHRDGSCARHVLGLTLLTPSGEKMQLDPERTPDTFQATAGGLGLTGVIVDATIQMLAVETPLMRVTVQREPDLDHTLAELSSTDHLHRYSVAWVDCGLGGRRAGRAVLMRGDHAAPADLPRDPRNASPRFPARRPLRVPGWAAVGPLMRGPTIAAFNELYFRRARVGRDQIQGLEPFFYPLDAVQDWNRLYGRRGFLQYQFVVPFGAEDVLHDVLRRLRRSRTRTVLGVLKRFGPAAGMLSFAAPGWTLALDVALPSPDLAATLDKADELVAGAGGRVYLAKDSRLRRHRIAEMYPELDRWREVQRRLDLDGRMQSDLARRIGLIDRQGQPEA